MPLFSFSEEGETLIINSLEKCAYIPLEYLITIKPPSRRGIEAVYRSINLDSFNISQLALP